MKPTDDRQAYEYNAVYVDDLCVASKDPGKINPQEQIQVQTQGRWPIGLSFEVLIQTRPRWYPSG